MNGQGAARQIALAWRSVPHTTLNDKISRLVTRPAPGMGVAPFAGGYWISIETLGPSAAKLVDAVREQQAALRAAPMVVIDMRGNGGGNSAYARQIIEMLQGEDRVKALDTTDSACVGAFWRASTGNLHQVRAAQAQAAKRGDTDTADWYASIVAQMEQALAAKNAFAPALPSCAAHSAEARPAPKLAASVAPAMRGKLVVVTDRWCFSSCLIAANSLRRLGALHVGETTNMATRYMEVREVTLPSGMRTFSTLQKVSLSSSDFGPYEPEIVYPGDLSDDKALKEWVAGLGKP
jgi:hypothetical protein